MASSSYNQSQNQSTNQAQNTANSQSSSSSFIPNYSQTPILERIAQTSEGMAGQHYNWGMGQFNKNQGNIDSLMNDAKRYEGQPQQAVDMGAAEAAVTNSGENARENSIRDLQSYGIDPSSGRYAALDRASQVQNTAAAAGAGNMQRNADMARANTERNQAISAGLQNSAFGNQVGSTANEFMGTAMRLPYSPLGTTSQSSSSSQGTSSGQSSGYSYGGSGSIDPSGGGGGGGGGPHGGGSKSPKEPQMPQEQGGGKGGSQPRSGGSPNGDGSDGGGGGGGDSQWVDPTTGEPTGGGGFDPLFQGGQSPWDAFNPDPGGSGGPFDPGGSGNNWGGDFNPTTTGPDNTDWSGGQTLGGDTWGGGDPGGGGSPGGEYRGGPIERANGGAIDDDQEEAMGGQDQGTTQGYDPEVDGNSVPAGHSPTRGQAIDDVPAKLTVGEFVMPDDVVKWKGEEFFQNLISKSRETRQNIMAVHGQTQGKSHNLGGAI